MAQRRLLSRLAHDEMDAGSFDLVALRRTLGERSVGAAAFGPFKTDLVARARRARLLRERVSASPTSSCTSRSRRIGSRRIGRWRAAPGRGAPGAARGRGDHRRLAQRHLGVELGTGDLQHLATLVLTRVVAPGATAPPTTRGRASIPRSRRRCARSSRRAAAEFLVDIVHEDFILRLALHVQNLRHRAREQAWSRNPLTRRSSRRTR